MAEPVKIHIPTEMKMLELVLDFCQGYARMQGMDAEALQIRLGLEEALSNVIAHGRPEDGIELSVEAKPHGVELLIRERGVPFDAEALERRVAEGGDDTRHGFGLLLMKSFMDEVSFQSLGLQGKQTRLFKRFAQVFEREPDVELMVEEPPVPKEKIEYGVRAMHPDEAVEVARCAYSAYGYSFINSNIYDSKYIREMNESGAMISLVAVTDDGDVMGHAAMLVEPDDPLCGCWGDAFVRKKYRRHGCLGRLSRGLMDEAEKRQFNYIYGAAVCAHDFSQRSLDSLGFTPLSLALACNSPMNFKGIDEAERRIDLLLCFKSLRQAKRLPLYLPDKHEAMIRRLYHGLGVDAKGAAMSDTIALPKRAYTVDVVAVSSASVKIIVREYGCGVIEEVRSAFGTACLHGAEVVYLFLDLSSPSAMLLTERFEEMGFFFCGIWPRSDGRDMLILQYLNSISVDYDAIKIASGQGRQLKEYVRDCEGRAAKPWSWRWK